MDKLERFDVLKAVTHLRSRFISNDKGLENK